MKKHGLKKLIAGLSAACVMGSALPAMSFAAETTPSKILGDSNGDGIVELADAILIMQALANPDKFGKGGSDPHAFSEQGWYNADVNGELGITTDDALTIQLYLLGMGKLTPRAGSEDPVAEATKIHLKNTAIEVEGENATVEGTKVTITHSGEFYIDGTLDDGQIEVNIPDEAADPETVKIFLNGANITGKSAPAILVTNAENTSINIVDGTTNSISDGDTAYAGDFLKTAVIEAKDDITFKGGDKGDGVLEITANTQDAVFSNNDIKFNGGTVNITTLNSTDGTDGVKAKETITVKDGTLNIDSEGDGIKSSKDAVEFSGGTTNIKAAKDAVQAETSISVSGGTLIAGGDRGLTAVTAINITGGTVIATATDNQADEKLMAGTTQTTVLLNCINDATNEKDGTWKKANALVSGSLDAKYTKKYKFVLYSDAAINGAKSCTFKNLATGASVTHTDGKQTQFQLGLVTTFNNVDPAGTGGGTVVEPTPAPEGLTITLSDSGMTTNASSEAKVENNVCTISQPGVFTVTGGMTGGQIVVDVDKTVYPDGVVELDLSGMSLTNTNTSPIYVASIADEVVVVAKNGTENTISDGESYTNADGDTGAVYSKDDIKFKGKGKLTVNGNAADAIVGKDDIKIYNGTLVVNAVDDGIRGKDSVTVGNTSDDGTEVDYSALSVSVNTKAGDGIKATSTEASSTAKQVGIVTINGGAVDIDSYADGISAEQFFVMNGGDLNIKTYEGSAYGGTTATTGGTTGGWGSRPSGNPGGPGMDGNANKTDISAKGIKAVGLYDEAGTTWQSVGDITVNGGTITIDSSDDCIHCGGSMQLIGGELKLSSADDGAHADHDLTIGTKDSGRYDDIVIAVEKCYEGIEAQKIYQNSGSVIVNATDDGYNAAGGSDGSGTGNTGMPWGQGFGGFGGGGFSGNSGDYVIEINGGFAIVNSANGDHDGFDSNGNIEINGGYLVSNGNEPYDCGDSGSTINVKGGVWVSDCPSGGMSMGANLMTASVSASANVNANTRLTLVGSDGKVIVSFIVDKSVSQLKAGGTGVSGASFYTGGTLSGSTYFQQFDQTQLAAYGGTLTGGSKV
ncbi:carbohydrate-binding domain-containing protein [Ruminococcus sp.]|uniref:carbohydrate-binding domain-containing protein n=1 Tax=Ruminococcus sp. TaxID=41978 RepID=UPI002B5C9184|nr:carbohydrate-binding domain-containing protein [Ruminococcus sp.]HNZ99938.1 carbohydrate-binding domain-containing protein [Ruminococcus sp.]HOH86235.1 carbohydrate-binding domain-containing protein [Ruminococcus sp.]